VQRNVDRSSDAVSFAIAARRPHLAGHLDLAARVMRPAPLPGRPRHRPASAGNLKRADRLSRRRAAPGVAHRQFEGTTANAKGGGRRVEAFALTVAKRCACRRRLRRARRRHAPRRPSKKTSHVDMPWSRGVSMVRYRPPGCIPGTRNIVIRQAPAPRWARYGPIR